MKKTITLIFTDYDGLTQQMKFNSLDAAQNYMEIMESMGCTDFVLTL